MSRSISDATSLSGIWSPMSRFGDWTADQRARKESRQEAQISAIWESIARRWNDRSVHWWDWGFVHCKREGWKRGMRGSDCVRPRVVWAFLPALRNTLECQLQWFSLSEQWRANQLAGLMTVWLSLNTSLNFRQKRMLGSNYKSILSSLNFLSILLFS